VLSIQRKLGFWSMKPWMILKNILFRKEKSELYITMVSYADV
jgi:hypothetical protein